MTMKLKLSETNIPALESQFAGPDRDKVDAVYWDTEIAGFGMRFRRGGKRTFVLQYKIAGSERRMTLGPYPGITAKKARELAQAALGDKWHGKDPQADRRAAKAKAQQVTTLAEVIDLYLLHKKSDLRPISFYETERYLRKVWKPLHSLDIGEIKRKAVAKILDELKHKTAAARARASLSAVFTWAMRRGHADANPVIGTENPDPHTQGERVLSGDELRALWNACDGRNDYDHIVRILILTGCRKSEVGGMRWSEFSNDRTVWAIPADRTKNGKSCTLPLPPTFWNVIDGIKQRDGTDNVFGYSDRGFRNWTHPKNDLDRRSGVSNWTHHDLRRTFRTGLGKLGIPPHIAELCINHSKGGLIAVYDKHRYEGEIAAALAMWADHVRSIIEGTAPTVVPIRKGIAPISA
jgi:integrase